jgi:ABC-type Fe3+/spermidine/putrescine transport system ATPase subunit
LPFIAAMSAPVIAVEAVSKHFGAVVAVERASFALPPGEFFSLLGPSGCGKTTLLRLIAGSRPTEGRIRLDGADVSAAAAVSARRQYGLSALCVVSAPLGVRQRPRMGRGRARLDRNTVRRQVGDMLAITRLTELADRRPEQLSGGQRPARRLGPRLGESAARAAAG